MMTDAEIVTAVLAGKRSEFAQLVDRYLAMVRGLCASHVWTASAQEDLVQETFTDGYVKLNTLRRRERFGPWLAVIARNKCIGWVRSETRRVRAHDALTAASTEISPSPTDAASREELHRFVQTQIAQLPERTREAMALCYVEGLSARDAAQFLDVSEAALRKRLQYGRQLVGESLWKEIEGRQRPEPASDRLKHRVLAAIPFTTAPLKVGLGSGLIGYVSGAKTTALLFGLTPLLVTGLALGIYYERGHANPGVASSPPVGQAAVDASDPLRGVPPSPPQEIPPNAKTPPAVAAVSTPRSAWTTHASGVVLDAAGNPQPGALVTFTQTPDRLPGRDTRHVVASDTTDRNGKFVVRGLGEALYSVTVRQSRIHRSATQRIAVIPIESAAGKDDIELTLESISGVALAGTVSNRKGEPVPGAHVSVAMAKRDADDTAKTESAVTASDGRFEIGGLPEGVCQIRVTHMDYTMYYAEGQRVPSATVSAVLDELGTIEGHVLDAKSGKPVPEFGLWAYSGELTTGILSWMLTELMEFKDSEGAFRLEWAGAGLDTLVVRAKGYAPMSQVVSGVPSGGVLSDIDIRLRPGATIAGKIVGAHGVPLSGAQVNAGGMYYTIRPLAVSGTDGAFYIDSLEFGELTLEASYPGYVSARVRVVVSEAGTSPVTIRLRRGGAIQGLVRKGGLPAEGYRVEYINTGAVEGEPIVRTEPAATDASGFYRITEVCEGPGAVVLRWTNHGAGDPDSSTERKVLVRAGQTTVVDFDVPEGNAAIEGVITLNGQPGAARHVDALAGDPDGATWRYDAPVDKSGYYRIENAPEGALILHVDYQLDGLGRARITKVVTRANETTRHDVELASGGSIVGAVSGLRDGERLTVVALWGATGGGLDREETAERDEREIAGFALTHEDGSFEIAGLEEGTYTVAASAQSGDARNRPPARSAGLTVKVPAQGEIRADLKLP